MASTNSTVDGMGFEEMNQPGSQTANVWLTGSLVTQAGIQTAGDISGAGNTYTTNVNATRVDSTYVSGNVHEATTSVIQNLHVDVSVSGVRFRETGKGDIYSTSIQNAGPVYGQRIRAGSVLTDDNGEGVIEFSSVGSFSSPNYFKTLTPRNWTVVAASGLNFMLSGTRRASGCEMYGPSGTVYDWIEDGI